MTSSFQSTAFQSSASPVDTFVRPPSVQPKTGIESLAETLAAVNPNLQKFIETKLEGAVKEERKKGQRIAFEEAKLGFKNITKDIRNTAGNTAANQLIGGSIFANDEYDKVKSQLVSDDFSNQIQGLYNNKRYTVTTEDNREIQVPITNFSVDSPEFQEFLLETSTIADNLTSGLKEDYVLDYFYPKQSETTQKIVTEHIKNHNTYNFNKLKKQSFAVITSAYGDYREGNQDNAITKINSFIDNKVLLGITQDNETKFFDSLLNYSLSLRDEAYTLDGIDGSNNVLKMMRGVKYGPNGASIFETHPKFLSEMHKQTIKHIKDKDAIDEIDNKNKQEEAETGILQLVNELGIKEGDLPYSTIERIRAFGSKYGVSVDWIDEKIDIFKPQRISKLKDFSFTLTEGTYIGRPVEATKQLGKLLNSLGPLTDEEDKIKTEIVSQIESSRKGQTEGSQTQLNTIKQRLRKQINPTYNSVEQVWEVLEGQRDPTGFMLNLERELDREWNTWLKFTDEDGDGVFDKRTANEINDYLVKQEDEAIKKIEIWQGGSNDPDGLITLPGEVFKGLGQNDAYEQITIDGQQALKNKESGKVYVSDEIIDTGGESSGFTGDPLNRNRPEPSVASEITQEDIDREKALDAEEASSYLIQAGDTLTSIAESFGTTVEDIMKANNITNADIINIGQQLNMPQNDIQELENNTEELEINFSDDTRVQSIVKSAKELGISPVDLAAVIAQESSFRPSVVSVDKASGKKYTGLIQFGPYEIAKYKIKPNMTFEEQMVAVTSFLKDRGVKPGHGAKEIYAAIFTGDVINLTKKNKEGKFGADWTDSNGTTVNKALPNLLKGGSKYKMAIDFLQQTGTYAPKPN
tara:strand:- start:5488 stop:8076 length:2589 start_codon:yes stop_codon:yes gene_type:complete